MTREEAIRRLRYIRMDYLGYPPFLEPLDMAIEALQAEANHDRPQAYKYGDICPSGDCGICGRLENGDCLCNDGKPKKVRYKLHKPIEYVYIEFDEEEMVQNIKHECGGGTDGWK